MGVESHRQQARTAQEKAARAAWDAARALTQKERLAQGLWSLQSARHAAVFYTVTVNLANGTATCNCPAGSYGRDCYHARYAETRERLIAQEEERAKAAHMRAQLLLLAAQYSEDEGLFHRVVQDFAEEVVT